MRGAETRFMFVIQARMAAKTIIRVCVARSTRRRSCESANTPPMSEKIMIGTTRHQPRHAERNGRTGQDINVIIDRNVLHLRANIRDHLSDPEQSKIAIL